MIEVDDEREENFQQDKQRKGFHEQRRRQKLFLKEKQFSFSNNFLFFCDDDRYFSREKFLAGSWSIKRVPVQSFVQIKRFTNPMIHIGAK